MANSNASKERLNYLLKNCIAYKVGGKADFRIPSIRLCPACRGLVEITDFKCKHVNNCPWCQTPFCASCLLPAKKNKTDCWEWQCGDYWSICPGGIKPRQQV
eukprot:CAMPEP_0168561666 /NCGR_PEP_ID=MMETSP0413-20121227/11716_1 /TAXON_ID=136452 /ORGANISM="Filamoeba nolandi, Strain NC-AS-23-1" /LENGTH=101 /DNA_ID=CAMNT_0008593051 /DNA_START=19 /DNA_END=324 /DNA_ORIENTATION=+